MKSRLIGTAAGLAMLLSSATAFAQDGEGDSSQTTQSQVEIGEQFTMTLAVSAPPGAAVEIDPANPSWAGIELVRVTSQEATPANDVTIHTFEIVVAGFLPGDGQIQAAVTIIESGVGTTRLLPPVRIAVFATLPPDAALELSPLAPAAGVDGAESPFLWPAIFGGGFLGIAAAALGIVMASRWMAARRPERVVEVEEEPLLIPDLGRAERLIDSDPVGAYKTLAATIRNVITERYGVPATSMTAREIQGRMEASGVDRWQARLVAGLLQECEQVVYGGYRPAAERRHADLSMAREIISGATP